MKQRPPRSKRTDTLIPNTTIFRTIKNNAVTPDKLSRSSAKSDVAASETTTSTSYTGLSTAQTVTVTVGANGLLVVGIGAGNTANSTSNAKTFMSFALSGDRKSTRLNSSH